jgi:DNA-binding MarR family transcriptional regulator
MKTNPGDLGCTCYRLRQAARLASRTYDRFLAPAGISIGQFGLLATLAAMEGESISALADVLQMERTTLTRNLSPLRKLGYVTMEDGSDRRAKALSLTEGGEKALAAATPMWQAAQQSMEKHLGTADIRTLNTKLEEALDRLPAN